MNDMNDDITGTNVMIRTVTNYFTGRVAAISASWIVLEDAAWIADTGRWADALKAGKLVEVEPYPDGPVYVARGAIVDVCGWAHKLPREQR